MTLRPDILEHWLEWAGVRLIALPEKRIGPNGYKNYWPDFSQEKFQVLDFRLNRKIRIPPPSNSEIPIMDEILLLPNICANVDTRRIIRLRTLLHPGNLRRLYTWPRISTTIDIKISNARYLYSRGLEEICRKTDPIKVCSISSMLSKNLADLERL